MLMMFIPSRRQQRLFWMLACIGGWLALPVFADGAKLVERFVLTDGSSVDGIMIRRDRASYTLATPDGLVTLRSRDVRVPGDWSRAAQQVDEILDIVEKQLAEKKWQRLNSVMPQLEQKIAEFERFVSPFINVSLESPQRASLEVAVATYRQRLSDIPKTAALLKQIERAKHLDRKLINKELRYNTTLLAELIALRPQLADDVPIPRVLRREHQRVSTTVRNHIRTCTKQLLASALNALKQEQDGNAALELLDVMKGGADTGAIYATTMSRLVKSAIAIVADYTKRLMPAVDQLFGLRSKDMEKRHFQKTADTVRQLSEFLEHVSQRVFGPDAETAQTDLRNQLATNAALLENALARREEIKRVRSELLQAKYELQKAEVALDRAAVDQAEKRFITLQKSVSASAFPTGDIQNELKTGVFRARAVSMLLQLRDPFQLPANALGKLIQRGRQFTDDNSDALVTHGFRPGAYEMELKKLTAYNEFIVRFDALKTALNGPPLPAWQQLVSLDKWTETKRILLYPQTIEAWQTFRDQKITTIFARVNAFFAQDDTIQEARFDILLSMLAYTVDNGKLTDAEQLTNQGLRSLGPAPARQRLQPIFDYHVRIADGYAEVGQYEKATTMLSTLRTMYPDYSSEQNIDDKDVVIKRRWADALYRQGKVAEASAMYDEIVATVPAYAERERLYARLLEMRMHTLPDDASEHDRLKLIDSICEQYPGQMGDLAEILEAHESIENEFVRLWKDGDYTDAIDHFNAFISDFESLSREGSIIQRIASRIRRDVRGLLKASEEDGGKMVPSGIVNSLEHFIKDHRQVGKNNGLIQVYFDLKMNLADEFNSTGQFIRAFAIYEQLDRAHPVLAHERNLREAMAQLKWGLRKERFAAPLGIKTGLDWLLFVVAALLWPTALYRAYAAGKQRGHLRYRLLHFAMTFAIFVTLLGGFLYGRLSFSMAFLCAFVLPTAIFQIIGACVYICFPLIYCERLLAFERLLLSFCRHPAFNRLKFVGYNPAVNFVSQDADRRAHDLPLLHDRNLYAIHRAVTVGESKPEKGYALLQKLRQRLDKELVKTESWREHYQSCLFHTGLLAWERDMTDEAIAHFQEDLEIDPKNKNSLQERKILADLLFNRGDYREAMPHIKFCLAAQGGTNYWWYRLGRCFFEIGDNVAAYKCFNSVADKDRDILFYGARAYARANDRKKSADWYQAVLKKYPQDSEAVYYLASSFAHHGDTNKAVKLAGLLQPGTPYHAAGQALLGTIHLRNGEVDKAGSAFDRALEIDPACHQGLLGHAQMAINAGQTEQATAQLRAVLATDSRQATANFLLGTLLETSAPDDAIACYRLAACSPEYVRIAERRSGGIFFARQDYTSAIEHFKVADAEGEQSPWFHYAYVYALAMNKSFAPCEKILVKLIGRTFPDERWQKQAISAIYTLGICFFEQEGYRLALQCLNFVTTNLDDSGKQTSLAAIIEETRFRMVVNLLRDREYIEAQNTVAELQIQTKNAERVQLCQYYLALCQLFLRDYDGARSVLTALLEKEPDNARYLYHQSVAELGVGDDATAANLMIRLRELPDTPPHLRAGLHAIRAYLTAKQGNLRDAALALSIVPELTDDFPGREFVRQKLLLTRVVYLAHLRDSRGIHAAINDLTDRNRIEAAYLHAVAATESGELTVARDLIAEYAQSSSDAGKLFVMLSIQLAMQAIEVNDYDEAYSALDAIPDPPAALQAVLLSLQVSAAINDLGTSTKVTASIYQLEEYRQQADGAADIQQMLLHNLVYLYLLQAVMLEDENDNRAAEAWDTCLEFWHTHVLKNTDYWSNEARRINSQAAPFDSREIAGLNRKLVLDNLAPVFIGYIFGHLDAGNDNGVLQHIGFLEIVGEWTQSGKKLFASTSKRLTAYVNTTDQSSERYKTWGFQIGLRALQVRLHELLEIDDVDDLRVELEIQRQCRAAYPTLKEYKAAKSNFTFELMDALRTGSMGSITDGASKLDKLLKEMPPGITLGKIEDSLRLLREACRQPGASSENADELKGQFDTLYGQIRDLD